MGKCYPLRIKGMEGGREGGSQPLAQGPQAPSSSGLQHSLLIKLIVRPAQSGKLP